MQNYELLKWNIEEWMGGNVGIHEQASFWEPGPGTIKKSWLILGFDLLDIQKCFFLIEKCLSIFAVLGVKK